MSIMDKESIDYLLFYHLADPQANSNLTKLSFFPIFLTIFAKYLMVLDISLYAFFHLKVAHQARFFWAI